MPFKTCPVFALLFVSPLSFFSVWFVRRRRFSFFLSLSQALGKPKPYLGFGFPLVVSSCWTRTSSTTRTPSSALSPRLRPRTCFFFFSFASSSFVGLLVGIVAVGCVLVRFFCQFVVVGCCSGSVLVVFALSPFLLLACKSTSCSRVFGRG